MAVKTLSAWRCARALWLLGLRDPVDLEEVRTAWKTRVAQAHPDRRPDQPEAAHRLTAAFNDARDTCERWAASGQPWPTPSPRVVSLEAEEEDEDDDGRPAPPPRRVPTEEQALGERRSGLRPGDLVRAAPDGELLGLVTDVNASSADAPVLVQLEDGNVHPAVALEPAAYGCPVCGHCEGPTEAPVRRRPCPSCLRDLARLERERSAAESVVRGVAARADAGRRRADDLGHHALGELARERLRWIAAVRRRPREERRDALLAAFAHGFAVWGEAPWGDPSHDR